MSLFDFTKTHQYKARIAELEEMLTPEHREIDYLRKEIAQLRKELKSTQKDLEVNAIKSEKEQAKFEAKIKQMKNVISELQEEIDNKKSQLVELDEEITMQEFGIYTPLYSAMSSERIKQKIEDCRERQKALIKSNRACTADSEWTVNGSKALGDKMIRDSIKQLLRSFNTECEAIIDKVKFNNLTAISERIDRSCAALNRMNKTPALSITPEYVAHKQEELRLVYEFMHQKEAEKEKERNCREALREQKKLQQEIKRENERILKEQKHFFNAINDLKMKAESSIDPLEKEKYLAEIAELSKTLVALKKRKDAVDYREKNTRAGYVYVISNIGSFGEDVYKIGVTRRLDPLERIKELGDASVPYKFDVHCMVFCDDAPKLETALHQAFDSFKLNRVNTRREYFRIPLNRIENVIRNNYNDTFEMKTTPDAEEFRISEKVRNNIIREEDVVFSAEEIEDTDDDDDDDMLGTQSAVDSHIVADGISEAFAVAVENPNEGQTECPSIENGTLPLSQENVLSFCAECGVKLVQRAGFCGQCGTEIR